MRTEATTIEEYLAALPEDRRAALESLRALVNANLQPGFEEAFSWGMISWEIPLATFPKTYNGKPFQVIALASQKNHMALYLMCAYMSPELTQILHTGFAAAKKKLDMGKSCLRFKTLDALALEPIVEVVRRCTVDSIVSAAEAAHRRA